MSATLPANPSPPIVLTFAASDPTGGAGLQADILTLASLGCHPLSVVTAITVQDTAGVEGVLPIDAEWVADQARALLEDMPVAAFKLGMLGSVEVIAAIAEVIADYPDIPVILDPVLASGRGDQFADEEMIEAMIGLLLPQTTLLTPNSLEARRLAQEIGEAGEDSRLGPDLALAGVGEHLDGQRKQAGVEGDAGFGGARVGLAGHEAADGAVLVAFELVHVELEGAILAQGDLPELFQGLEFACVGHARILAKHGP